jgi:hypothetical protein
LTLIHLPLVAFSGPSLEVIQGATAGSGCGRQHSGVVRGGTRGCCQSRGQPLGGGRGQREQMVEKEKEVRVVRWHEWQIGRRSAGSGGRWRRSCASHHWSNTNPTKKGGQIQGKGSNTEENLHLLEHAVAQVLLHGILLWAWATVSSSIRHGACDRTT